MSKNRIIIFVSMALFLMGCQSFEDDFLELHSIHSTETGIFPVTDDVKMIAVLEDLGEPLHKEVSGKKEGIFFGPQEGLESILDSDSPYEQWTYQDGKFDYYIWFRVSQGQVRDEWRVVAVAKYPTGAAF